MTKIEWTKNADGTQGQTWNPTVGCSRKSDGCTNCYAEVMTKRLEAMGNKNYQGLLNEYGRFNGVLRLNEDNLLKPLKTKKPTTYFVNSMSDLFHETVKDEWIDKVFAVMALCPQHTFQILTKRADRMQRYFSGIAGGQEKSNPEDRRELVALAIWGLADERAMSGKEALDAMEEWPLSNVWLGVSVENQKTADERIPLLLETPAKIRFLSCEPLLEHIVFDAFTLYDDQLDKQLIDWVIVGGESGHGARPCDVAWIRSIVEQCKSASVPVFVKQMGANPVALSSFSNGEVSVDCFDPVELKNKKGGDITEFPKDLRVREYPA